MDRKLSDAMQFMINPGLSLLPKKYGAVEAKAMLLTIALQESGLTDRRQVLNSEKSGPARGYLQFERNGIFGVLNHQSIKHIIHPVLDRINYSSTVETCHDAVEHNDMLACVFGRLLLWSSSLPLPKKHEHEKGWDLYVSTWRPGKPRPETWPGFFNESWNFIMRGV